MAHFGLHYFAAHYHSPYCVCRVTRVPSRICRPARARLRARASFVRSSTAGAASFRSRVWRRRPFASPTRAAVSWPCSSSPPRASFPSSSLGCRIESRLLSVWISSFSWLPVGTTGLRSAGHATLLIFYPPLMLRNRVPPLHSIFIILPKCARREINIGTQCAIAWQRTRIENGHSIIT